MLKKLALVMLLAGVVASPVFAGPIQVSTGGYGPWQQGSGGEFTLKIESGLSNSAYGLSTKDQYNSPSFQTFCIENSVPPEYIYTSTLYDATIDRNAVTGGVGGGTTGDPISVGTGWLYSQFALGALAGYNYANTVVDPSPFDTRKLAAGALQQAIWWLEQEGGVTYTDANPFMLAAFNMFGSELDARYSGATVGGWTYGVYALNLTKNADGILAQSQLIYVPDGGATLMLLGGALIGLGALRRKLRG